MMDKVTKSLRRQRLRHSAEAEALFKIKDILGGSISIPFSAFLKENEALVPLIHVPAVNVSIFEYPRRLEASHVQRMSYQPVS